MRKKVEEIKYTLTDSKSRMGVVRGWGKGEMGVINQQA